jgi:biotin transport system substrate-specific component
VESRIIVRIALLAAVIAVLGMLPSVVLLIAMGVPITAQTLGVMLAGIIFGPRHGVLAALLFLFVVLLGAPLLSGDRGGVSVLFGPSVGFLLGFVPAAYISGLMIARLKNLPLFAAALVAAITGGIVVEYACGVLRLMAITRMSLPQALVAIAVFVPGDLLKALATGIVAEAAHRSYPAAIASRS